MIKTVTLCTIVLSIVICTVLYIMGFSDTAFSVLIGSSVTLINFILLSYGITKLLDAKPVAIFFNSFRLLLFIAIFSTLIYLRLANVVGLFSGFTITIVTIAVIGIIHSKIT
ncbi:MAG: ATP synthase subunit I [Nitrospirae bacterium]|nr:ATP synthase subunit I [Nitrospirota bacterium]MBF0534699.1 ATP synthase subunit I [Nitrospirota bacterium]MBF0616257.1 ATP synthase subunit I [Nitrospirota bacterium]